MGGRSLRVLVDPGCTAPASGLVRACATPGTGSNRTVQVIDVIKEVGAESIEFGPDLIHARPHAGQCPLDSREPLGESAEAIEAAAQLLEI